MAAPVNPPCSATFGLQGAFGPDVNVRLDGDTEIIDTAESSVALKLENPYSV
jgi:hypothetical protein